MSLHDIYYNFPQAAYLMPIVFLFLILLIALQRYRQHQLEKFASPKLQSAMVVPHSEIIYWCKVLALCIVWIAATYALMQPMGYGEYPEGLRSKSSMKGFGGRQRKPQNVILLLDASTSMSVPDASGNVRRLDFAKDIADQIISKLDGQTIALHAFTSETSQLSPLTTDYLFVRLMLRQLRINEVGVPGTDFKETLSEIRKLYFAEETSPTTDLVVLSDGGDTLLESLQGTEREGRLKEILDLVSDGEKNHYRVFTVGMGSRQGMSIPGITFEGKQVISAVDEELLKQVSLTGRGKYYFANDFSSLDLSSSLAAAIKQDTQYMSGEALEQQGKPNNLIHRLYFQIPLAIAILFFTWIILFPNRYALRELKTKAA